MSISISGGIHFPEDSASDLIHCRDITRLANDLA